jgi:hypothetical protein
VRVVLALAAVLTAGTFVIEMSGSAPRTAGSDHSGNQMFSAILPRRGLLCQPAPRLPADAARVQLRLGTYDGSLLTGAELRFADARGGTVAVARVPPGSRQGAVTIPLTRTFAAPAATSVCLRAEGSARLLVGGEVGQIAGYSEQVNGRRRPGRISLLYLRAGNESWWQLLPVLSHRFALGKASFLAAWTLPVLALIVACVWCATYRLLVRELE